MTYQFKGPCPVCGGGAFALANVLWPELIAAWQLTESEADYVNRQQGLCCQQCGNNLRAMGLAAAVLRAYTYPGNLIGFCKSFPNLRVLEINTAGNLTSFLKKMPGHRLVEYPQFDMMNLDIESKAFDLVLHSDSLEHVPDPDRGLAECRRVLDDNGRCIFTAPIIVGRASRSRLGLAPSYHGQAYTNAPDQLVHTEFGTDIWTNVMEAGFVSCDIFSLEYPAALAIIART